MNPSIGRSARALLQHLHRLIGVLSFIDPAIAEIVQHVGTIGIELQGGP